MIDGLFFDCFFDFFGVGGMIRAVYVVCLDLELGFGV